ncbi:Dabb family protein [Verrucomicrobia bacterium]|nr:Dabb family protein [Verrucomicrobiota bacterium]MDB4459030.1 Dabb family protein [bacterium]
MIHSVSFKLKDDLSRADHESFFQAARQLGEIPGVIGLRLLRQTSTKNPFAFCLSMEFSDESTYESYSCNPLHSNFVRQQWMTKVETFQEADFEDVNDWAAA